MQPLVLVDGDYSASLGGLTLAGDRVLEIKCPFRGRDSALWKSVQEGKLPEHYRWQVQHQLMVDRAEVADVFVFDGDTAEMVRRYAHLAADHLARYAERHCEWERAGCGESRHKYGTHRKMSDGLHRSNPLNSV
jgi:YqaJ-like viral recombinase domain